MALKDTHWACRATRCLLARIARCWCQSSSTSVCSRGERSGSPAWFFCSFGHGASTWEWERKKQQSVSKFNSQSSVVGENKVQLLLEIGSATWLGFLKDCSGRAKGQQNWGLAFVYCSSLDPNTRSFTFLFLKRCSCYKQAVGWLINEHTEFQKNKVSHCHGKFMLSKHYKTRNDLIHS